MSNKVLPWAVAFALFGFVLAIAAKNMIVDLDLYHEMSLFRQMQADGEMPRTDAFAYTPTVEPVVHHEWATGAIMYLVSVATGWGGFGVVLVKYLLTFGICVGCYCLAVRRGATQAVLALTLPIALNVGGWMAFTNVRAQLFTLFFFVLLFFLIDEDRKGKRWWIGAWLVLFVIWANVHGGVLSGLGMLALYGCVRLGESWIETRSVAGTFKNVRHLLAVGVVSFLLLYVNPYGSDYVPYLLRAVTMPRPMITEWLPLWQVKLPLFYGLSVFIAAFGIWFRGKEFVFESLAVVLTAYLAWKHYRHGSLYAVTWACFVPAMVQGTHVGCAIQDLWKKYTPQVAVIAFAIGLVATGYSIQAKFWKLRIPNQRQLVHQKTVIYPVGACDYLRDHEFNGNLFVPFNSGAYVSWKLFPAVKISIDSRYEVAFPPGAIEEEAAFYSAEDGWEAIPKKYDTKAILVPTSLPVAKFMLESNEARRARGELKEVGEGELETKFPWSLVYTDNSFSIYIAEEFAADFPLVDRTNQLIEGVFP